MNTAWSTRREGRLVWESRDPNGWFTMRCKSQKAQKKPLNCECDEGMPYPLPRKSSCQPCESSELHVPVGRSCRMMFLRRELSISHRTWPMNAFTYIVSRRCRNTVT